MIKVVHKTSQKELHIQRVLGSLTGSKQTPTLVFTAGIHGNETAGVFALNNVFRTIEEQKIPLQGNFIGLSGNLSALTQGIRFNKQDLNRLWTDENLEYLKKHTDNCSNDEQEMLALYNIIKGIINKHKPPFYFIDLHTTSSQTNPFITISDAINNRLFSSCFPVPTILGIEEYLDGPLLSYINEFGHTAIGFEAGEHYSEQSITNCEAFIWLSLVNSNCIEKKYVEKYHEYQAILANSSHFKNQFFEIKYRYEIQPNESFVMKKGFINFDVINEKEALAVSNSNTVLAPFGGRIFMPLYQKQGEDGFFIISKVSKFWLIISRYVRRLKIYKLLQLLPGIKADKKALTDKIIVNPKTARFLTTKIFHLFGYRKKVVKENKWIFTKRDMKVRMLS